jgi:hypothetical protein
MPPKRPGYELPNPPPRPTTFDRLTLSQMAGVPLEALDGLIAAGKLPRPLPTYPHRWDSAEVWRAIDKTA